MKSSTLSPDASVYQENEQCEDEGTQKNDTLKTEGLVNPGKQNLGKPVLCQDKFDPN